MTTQTTKTAAAPTTHTNVASMSFSQLNLAPHLMRAVAEMGYDNMTPIQAQAIPAVLQGRDVMGAAQTGTGKTAAFSLPLLQRLLSYENASTSPARHPVRALVLLPTRELADQVAKSIQLYAKYTQMRTAVVFGGMDMKPQTLELKAGVEILVATPGRLLDHIEAKSCNLSQVEYVVLDEADRMLDIGFLPDLQRILSHLPKQRTTLLFSATFSNDIKRLCSNYLQNPITIEVANQNQTATNITQHFYAVSADDKIRLLYSLLKEKDIQQAFVFVNSKMGCSRLAHTLEASGLKAAALHGDKTQDERLKALEAFKRGEVQLLVATDVAARGLDIKDVPAVFNMDLPFNAEDYVHRIGRTGRAGASGIAMSFVSPSDSRLVVDLEKLLQRKLQLETTDSMPALLNLPSNRTPNQYKENKGQTERRDFSSNRSLGFNGQKNIAQKDPFFDRPYTGKVTSGSITNGNAQAIQSASQNTQVKKNTINKKNLAALLQPLHLEAFFHASFTQSQSEINAVDAVQDGGSAIAKELISV